MITGAMGLVGGIMISFNGARRYVYYWDNVARTLLTLIVQALFIWKADLSSVRAVLWFGIASGLPSLLIQPLVALYGYTHGPRRIAGLDGYHEQG